MTIFSIDECPTGKMGQSENPVGKKINIAVGFSQRRKKWASKKALAKIIFNLAKAFCFLGISSVRQLKLTAIKLKLTAIKLKLTAIKLKLFGKSNLTDCS